MSSKYPKLAEGEESERPYRLWNANERQLVRWRCYKYPKNAHMGALIETRWAKPGVVFEVIDIRTAALLGQYRRTPTSVAFTDVRKLNEGPEGEQYRAPVIQLRRAANG